METTIPSVLPWEEWTEPQFVPADLGGLRVRPEGSDLVLYAGAQEGFDGAERLGAATPSGLHDFAHALDFPVDFVNKLPLDLRASVINSRVEAAREREVSPVLEDGRWTAFVRGARQILPYRETAQLTWDTVREIVGDQLTIDHAGIGTRGLTLTLLTGVERPITRRVGDILSAGIQVRQDYGGSHEVSLFTRRLICLNGMTGGHNEWHWSRPSESSAEHQRLWLREGVVAALGSFQGLVDRAREMAETPVEGEPEEALIERARALGVPRRHHSALLDAWRQEEDASEWGMVNALTRMATHNGLPGDLGRRLQRTAGEWTGNFDIVTARLPLPVAQRVGARIIPDPEGE